MKLSSKKKCFSPSLTRMSPGSNVAKSNNPRFLARGELSGWLGNQHVMCKPWKVLIDFRSSQVRHALLYIH